MATKTTETTLTPTAQWTAFALALDWTIAIRWDGRVGVHQIDEDRLVRLTICTMGTIDHYVGIKVEIKHKHNGLLDSRDFEFDGYLPTSMAHRRDTRADYPLARGRCFEVVGHCGIRWYIAEPQTAQPLIEAIEAWIAEWR